MKYTKTKSGKWHTQVFLGYRDGKAVRVSVTAATKRECMDQAAKVRTAGMPEAAPKHRETLGECIDRYIESSETLSPTTLAGYRKIRRTMFTELMDLFVDDLDNETLQKAINAEMRRKSRRGHNISAKSIKNAYGLVSASLRAFHGRVFTVKLPQSDPKFLELPEPEFVLEAIRGTEIELPCLLAMWLSLTMSEVRGLKYSSFRNGCVYIDQVVVDVDGVPTEKKRGKTAARNRFLRCPEYIMDLVRRDTAFNDYEAGRIFDGYIWPHSHDKIRHALNKVLPGVNFHLLRHMNTSIMVVLRIPERYMMERNGWSSPHVMRSHYEDVFTTERLRVDDQVDAFFYSKLHNLCAQEAAEH